MLLCLTLYSRGQDLCLISLHRMPDFCDVILLRVIIQVGPLDCQVEEDSIILGSRHTFRCVDIYVSTLEFVLTIGVSHTVRPKKSAILYM